MADMVHSRNPSDRIIVALDQPSATEALALTDTLRPELSWFKVGLELFTATGRTVIDELRKREARIFLDLKLHDIPRTVARTIGRIERLGVSLTTLHAAGGRAMMEAATEALEQRTGGLKLLAVTVLTSLDAAALRAVGIHTDPEELVPRLAALAEDCGMDGVVCSPLEVERLRAETRKGFLIVTPGIRTSEDAADDQARVAGPAEAVRLGSDYLVVGRPITQAPDPLEAARRIAAKIAAALP